MTKEKLGRCPMSDTDFMYMGCIGKDCALWDFGASKCSFASLNDVVATGLAEIATEIRMAGDKLCSVLRAKS